MRSVKASSTSPPFWKWVDEKVRSALFGLDFGVCGRDKEGVNYYACNKSPDMQVAIIFELLNETESSQDHKD